MALCFLEKASCTHKWLPYIPRFYWGKKTFSPSPLSGFPSSFPYCGASVESRARTSLVHVKLSLLFLPIDNSHFLLLESVWAHCFLRIRLSRGLLLSHTSQRRNALDRRSFVLTKKEKKLCLNKIRNSFCFVRCPPTLSRERTALFSLFFFCPCPCRLILLERRKWPTAQHGDY